MRLATFCPGADVRLFDEIYAITKWNATTRIVSLVSGNGTRRDLELDVLVEQYQLGNARPIADGKAAREASNKRLAARKRIQKDLLIDLPAETLREIEFRVNFLKWLEERGIALSGSTRFAKIQALYRTDHDLAEDAWVPSLSTAKRWRAAAWAGHGDRASLTPRYRNRGGAGIFRLAPEVEDLITRCIDNYFLTGGRNSMKSAHELLQGDIAAANAFRAPDNKLTCPGYMTVKRRIEARPAYERFASRYNKKAADHLFRSVTIGISNRFAFMEAWQMDHTSLDICVIDEETKLSLGRPRLTLITEVRSRMVMGFTIGFDGMSAIASLECLHRAILPKNRSELRDMGVKGAWPAFGLPIVLIMDNGTDFHSKAMKGALLELGIESQYAPRRKAWFKGVVERAIGKFVSQGTGYLPGATVTPHLKATMALDKDPLLDPTKIAVVGLKDLESVLSRWVVDQYLNATMAALQHSSPGRYWELHGTPERLHVPEDTERLSLLCTLRTTRVVTMSGIALCNIRTFNSPGLQKVRRDRGHTGIEVEVRYSPRKLARLWFQPPGTTEWHEVLNSDPETADLSEKEMTMIVAHQKAVGRDTGRQITFSESRRELAQWARDLRTADTQAKRRIWKLLTGISAQASAESDNEDTVEMTASEKKQRDRQLDAQRGTNTGKKAVSAQAPDMEASAEEAEAAAASPTMETGAGTDDASNKAPAAPFAATGATAEEEVFAGQHKKAAARPKNPKTTKAVAARSQGAQPASAPNPPPTPEPKAPCRSEFDEIPLLERT